MTTILAIDAAWTIPGPSGVALVRSANSGWRCVAVAPSYDAFYALSKGTPVQWTQGSFNGSIPNISRLLRAAQQLTGTNVDVVTVDIPVATVPIIGRRAADQAISTVFGGCGCSTHSPNQSRPGRLGATLMQDLAAAGYALSTTATMPGMLQCTVEVYPHPALLTLLNRDFRVPYKVGKSTRYWPGTPIFQRVQHLLVEFTAIEAALAQYFGGTTVPLPAATPTTKLAYLKRFEDALDALVCAWVGTRYVARTIHAHGDPTAAIWTP